MTVVRLDTKTSWILSAKLASSLIPTRTPLNTGLTAHYLVCDADTIDENTILQGAFPTQLPHPTHQLRWLSIAQLFRNKRLVQSLLFRYWCTGHQWLFQFIIRRFPWWRNQNITHLLYHLRNNSLNWVACWVRNWTWTCANQFVGSFAKKEAPWVTLQPRHWSTDWGLYLENVASLLSSIMKK